MLKSILVRFGIIIIVFGATSPITMIFPDNGLATFIWFFLSLAILIWIAVKFFGQKLF
tara:strand:+ start:300 stop:473 length:174 start_codon:yes stop_codon:yes gene_type:complete